MQIGTQSSRSVLGVLVGFVITRPLAKKPDLLAWLHAADRNSWSSLDGLEASKRIGKISRGIIIQEDYSKTV